MSDQPTTAPWPYGPNDRVVLGWKGLVVGILISDIVFFLFWTIPGLKPDPSHISYALSVMLASMIIGLIPIGAIGAAVGWLLGLALRRVRNQWIHVAAFFAAGALICVPFGGFSSPTALAYPLSIALAAGLARLSIWKLVHINDQPSLT